MTTCIALAFTPSGKGRALRSLAGQADLILLAATKDTLEEAKAAKVKGLKAKVVLLPEDFGPLNGLVALLNTPQAASAATWILVADDREYDTRLVETLTSGLKRHPGSAVSLGGHVIGTFPLTWGYRSDRPSGGQSFLAPESPIDIVSIRCGVAMPASIFTPTGGALDGTLEGLREKELRELSAFPDLYLSAWLDILGSKKTVVAYSPPGARKAKGGAVEIKKLKSFLYVVRNMRSRGLLCSNLKVAWHKSTVFLASSIAMVAVAVAAVVAVIGARQLLRYSTNKK